MSLRFIYVTNKDVLKSGTWLKHTEYIDIMLPNFLVY